MPWSVILVPISNDKCAEINRRTIEVETEIAELGAKQMG